MNTVTKRNVQQFTSGVKKLLTSKTKVEVATMIGKSPRQLGRYLNQEAIPSNETIQKLQNIQIAKKEQTQTKVKPSFNLSTNFDLQRLAETLDVSAVTLAHMIQDVSQASYTYKVTENSISII
jgi:hypothetical protein